MDEQQNTLEKIKPQVKIKKSIESEDSVEAQIERGREKVLEIIAEKKEKANDIVQIPLVQPVGGITAGQEQKTKKIEYVLQDGLEEIYLDMPKSKQREFKREGEKTAAKINQLMSKTKINVKKIINLIKKWLSIITGINSFFLEQEAKIKADEIFKIKIEK